MMEHLLPVLGVTLFSLMGMAAVQARYPGKEARILWGSWAFHFVATFANAYMIKVIYGRGDPLSFFRNGTEIAEVLSLDLFEALPNVVMMVLQQDFEIAVELKGGKGSTRTMFALSGLAQFVFGKSFYAAHLAFGMASFYGKVGIYNYFRSWCHPRLRLHALAAATLVPSVVFWSAGQIKEAVAIMALGLAGQGMALLYRKRPVGFLLLGAGVYGVGLIKPFILLTLCVAAAGYLYWYRSVRSGRVEIRPMTLVAMLGLAAFGLVAVGYVFPKYSLANLGKEAAAAQAVGRRSYGSMYSIGNPNDTSLLGQLPYFPLGLFTGWFRPGIWEARNPQMLLNGLETAAFLGYMVRGLQRSGYKGFTRRLVATPELVFCLLFALGMGVGTGLTSANLGTLSRYRMPLVPFLVMAIILLNMPVAQTTRKVVKRVRRKTRRRQNTSRSPI